MILDKNCPFSGKPCNTDCAMLMWHGHENHYTQRYDYTYSCGLVNREGFRRFTPDMKETR